MALLGEMTLQQGNIVMLNALDAREAEMMWMIKSAASSMKWPIILSLLTMFSSQRAPIPSCSTCFGRVPPFWCPSSHSSCLSCKEVSSLFTYTVRMLIGFGCSLSHFLGWVELPERYSNMDRPNSPGTPGSSLYSAKFMINDQTD